MAKGVLPCFVKIVNFVTNVVAPFNHEEYIA